MIAVIAWFLLVGSAYARAGAQMERREILRELRAI
jgi:hypothetical protein